jgi:predicted secreted protein
MLFFDPHDGGGYFDHLVHRAFAVLPSGARSQHETGDIAPGTDPGAGRAWLAGKAIWTTLIPVVVFAALVAFADYAG